MMVLSSASLPALRVSAAIGCHIWQRAWRNGVGSVHGAMGLGLHSVQAGTQAR